MSDWFRQNGLQLAIIVVGLIGGWYAVRADAAMTAQRLVHEVQQRIEADNRMEARLNGFETRFDKLQDRINDMDKNVSLIAEWVREQKVMARSNPRSESK